MQELKELIYQGEKVDIECKKAEKSVPKSAYESYSAFANTKGGYIILGVREDKTKTDLSQDVDVDEEVDDDVARYSVIDGQQRLTAIYGFMTNAYKLEGLEVLELLNGSYYKDLPPFLIRRLEERTIKCLRIDSTVDPQVKFDIFERLNSGAVQLESQELRNAIYNTMSIEEIKNTREKIVILEKLFAVLIFKYGIK